MQRFLLYFLLLSFSSLVVGCDSGGDDDDNGDTLRIGSSVNGTLETSDSVCNNERRCDRYTLEIDQSGEVTISMTSSDFDTYLYLYRGSELLEADDDGGEIVNALITRTLAAGQYEIRASQFDRDDDFGAYRLSVN